MSEPQFDEQTLRSSLADIEAGMVRYVNWFNGERPRDAYDLIHHAWMQGACVGSLETGVASMNCYGQRQYRMAWFAGFDIAKRIRACAARIAELERTIQEMPDERVSAWQLGAKLIAAQNRIAELERERDAWNVEIAEQLKALSAELGTLTRRAGQVVAERDQIRADLKTHMHLVRTMGERCGLLGGLLREVLNVENQIGPNDTVVGPNAKLVERIERALAQGEGRG